MPFSLQDIANAVLQALTAWFNPFAWLRSAVKQLGPGLLDPLAQFLTATRGPLSGEGLTTTATVGHFAGATQALADGALALVLAWAFVATMWQPHVSSHYRWRVLLPRLLLAFVLINFSLPLAQGVIDFNRVLSRTIAINAGVDARSVLHDLERDILSPAITSTLLVSLAMFVALGLLLIVYVLRYALLAVLVITAPLAALLFVLPETSAHARTWFSLFCAALFMQPLQLLILGIGWNLDAHDFGISPFRHLFALACLVLCFHVPGVLSASGAVGRKAMSVGHRESSVAWKSLTKAKR